MTEEEIYSRMPKWVIGVEEWNWYDGIAYYYDQANNQRYSRNGYPIANDEICKRGKVYKVEIIRTGKKARDYKFKILSERDDIDENDKGWMLQVP